MSGARLVIEQVKDVTVVTFSDTTVVEGQHIEQIRRELAELVEKKNRSKLVLDMARVSHLSSTALGMLIPLADKTRELKGDLVLLGVQPSIRKVFKITKLEKKFKFKATEAEALKVFGVAVD